MQEVARDELGDRAGSVVAIDPRNGEILALWSYPTYDPNLLATHDFAAATAESERLNERPRQADPGPHLRRGELLPARRSRS